MVMAATAYDPLKFRIIFRQDEQGWNFVCVERKVYGTWDVYYTPMRGRERILPERNLHIIGEMPSTAVWSTWTQIAAHQLWRYLELTREDRDAPTTTG